MRRNLENYQYLKLETLGDKDQVVHIQLDKQPANAFNLDMCQEFDDCTALCESSTESRVLLISATGKRFCSGADVTSFSTDDTYQLIRRMTQHLNAAFSRLARMDKAVVAVVKGSAAGAGLGLMLSCDYVVASDETFFTTAYTAIGVPPDCGVSWFLPQQIGQRRALELLLTNRRLSAEEALQWGMINEVTDAAQAFEQAKKMALTLAAGPRHTFGKVKRLLLNASYATLEAHMEQEAHHIATAIDSEEGREGTNAFRARRTPSYKN